jgi:hypothetical protein
MKIHLRLTIISIIFLASLSVQAGEILGSGEGEVATWAKQNGYTVQGTQTGSSGCHQGKRYVQLGSDGLKVYALFYQPLYKENSKVVTQVEFEPATPLSLAKAKAMGVQAAPIAGTRPPTHKQKVEVDSKDPCAPPNGGFEERYTSDYLIEYHYAPGGGMVERVKVTNENVR